MDSLEAGGSSHLYELPVQHRVRQPLEAVGKTVVEDHILRFR